MVPLRGLCEIVAVQEEEMLGQTHLFYEMRPLAEEGIVKIPASQLEAQGIRATLSPERMEQLLQQDLECGEPPEGKPHQRLKKWVQMLRSDGIGARLRVLVLLNRLEKKGERLSKKEQELQDQIRLAFRHEVETVMDLSAPQAGRKVNLAIAE